MNKALEQKLIGPMEESHTKEQSPQAVLWEVLWARRSKMAARWARTRVWARWGFFLEEDKVCGCRNKWRGPRGAHKTGGAPRGVGRAHHPRGALVSFPDCYLIFYFSKYSKTEKYCLKNCFGVGLLTVPHTYSFSGSETFRKVSFMYSSGVTFSITLVSTFMGLPEI